MQGRALNGKAETGPGTAPRSPAAAPLFFLAWCLRPGRRRLDDDFVGRTVKAFRGDEPEGQGPC